MGVYSTVGKSQISLTLTLKGQSLISVGKKEISYYVTPKEEEINCAENWNPDRSPTVKRVSMNG